MNTKRLNKSKNNKRKISFWMYIAFIVLLIFFLILTIDVLIKPDVISSKAIDNQINETYKYSYQVEVEPCTIYPEGGIVNPSGNIITKITNKIIVNINSDIKADKPINVKCVSSVSYKIIAEDLWEKEFTLDAEKNIRKIQTATIFLAINIL